MADNGALEPMEAENADAAAAGSGAQHTHVDVLVIGAGPTGLGAGVRLQQHGHGSWMLIEGMTAPGGLARSETTPQGFLFDMGGHVIFSHYQYFDDLLDYAVGTGPEVWSTIERCSFIWLKDRYVPYPFQNNLHVLDSEDQAVCLRGLVDATVAAAEHGGTIKPTNFDEWILSVMGEGIANLFMRPYNFKVWAIPTSGMQCDWLGDRTKPIDVKAAITGVIEGRPLAPQPKSTFRYPQTGGTGGIWHAVERTLPKERVHYGKKVVGLDLDRKIVVLADQTTISYDACLSTMPLDYTLALLGRQDLAARLFYSSSHIIGLGIRGSIPHGKKSWLYYPEANCPFYRCTCFSTYAKGNVPSDDAMLPTLRLAGGKPGAPEPRPGPYWSLMFEVSESPLRPVNRATVVEDTIKGAISTQLIDENDEIVSVYHRHLPHGYPTPTVVRDQVLSVVLPELKSKQFYSRGRFGCFKYEVANQDHSVMMGVEAVDNILFGAMEVTHDHPPMVSKMRNVELVYTPPATDDQLEE